MCIIQKYCAGNRKKQEEEGLEDSASDHFCGIAVSFGVRYHIQFGFVPMVSYTFYG